MELRTVHTPTGGSSRESSTMGASLMEQHRVSEEGFRLVKLCCWRRTCVRVTVHAVTVSNQKVTANYVPAVAVIRRWQALSGFIGRKASAGGCLGLM